ncbi:MAG: DsrE family protein [Proteobacteria bacterium]|jgi:intracellular sulfur oxidation DsrE/DsrF family protein|nr:DsrE family protein [Pseudomonadota bacterium]
MKIALMFVTVAAFIGATNPGFAQDDANLPVPNVGVELEVPGAVGMPNPDLNYKVVFDIVAAASQADEVNPGLIGVGQFLNTLAKQGVPAEHRQIAIVLHRDATEVILNNEAHQARNDGHDNPNLKLLQDLKKAGVDIRQCGQAVVIKKIDPSNIVPEVQLDYWALTTLLEFQLDGYVKVGG